MNVANLQLQGLYLAIAAVNNALVVKGLLTRGEIADCLERAEQIALGDDRIFEGLNPASRDAIAFAPRLLAVANSTASEDGMLEFSELARRVGQTKGHYPDEL